MGWRGVAAVAVALVALYCGMLAVGGRGGVLREARAALHEEAGTRPPGPLPSAYAPLGRRLGEGEARGAAEAAAGRALELRYAFACPPGLAHACRTLGLDDATDAWLAAALAHPTHRSRLAAAADALLRWAGVGHYTRGALWNGPRLFLLSTPQWALLTLGTPAMHASTAHMQQEHRAGQATAHLGEAGPAGEGAAHMQQEHRAGQATAHLEQEGQGTVRMQREGHAGQAAAYMEQEDRTGQATAHMGEKGRAGEGTRMEGTALVEVAPAGEGGVLQCLDVGAGLGWVTARAASALCGAAATTAVEANAVLAWRLEHNTGVRVLAHPQLSRAVLEEAGLPTQHALLFLLNVLDRLAAPAAFLARMRPLLAPGGRLLVALPLPWMPIGQDAADPLHIAGSTWEDAAHDAARAFAALGWRVERLTRAPYLCTGSPATPLHVLDAALFRLAPQDDCDDCGAE